MPGRRYRRRQKLPISQRSFAIITISIIEIVLFMLVLFLYVRGLVQGAGLFSIVGIICIISSFAAILLSVRDMLNRGNSMLSRIFCILLPIVSFVIWMGTYLIGVVSL